MYYSKLYSDIPCQFKNKQKISALLKVFSRQLDELKTFFDELLLLRRIETAQGLQLDGIGDIVCLTRADAVNLSYSQTDLKDMDDETYREWLKYKIIINTSSGTYNDIRTALKMLLGDKKVDYTEKPEEPATITLDISSLSDGEVLRSYLLQSIKAAGVKLDFTVKLKFSGNDYHAGATSEYIKEKYSDNYKFFGSEHTAGAISLYLKEKYYK